MSSLHAVALPPKLDLPPTLSPIMARVADVAVHEGGPWLVKHRNSMHEKGLEHGECGKYRTQADIFLDQLICNAILDGEAGDVVIFSEERGLITIHNRDSVNWDDPRRENVNILDLPCVAVVDSLDGTLNWASRGLSNNYSIAVTLLKYGQPVEVVIFFPHDCELYIAKKGEGAWMRGSQDTAFARIHTSNVVEINRSVVIVDHGKVNKADIYPIKMKLAQDGIGAVAIPDLVCSSASWRAIARGGAHAFFGYTVAPEDYYTSLLVTEAGGVVTTLDGRGQWTWTENRSVFAAANPVLHEKLREFCHGK